MAPLLCVPKSPWVCLGIKGNHETATLLAASDPLDLRRWREVRLQKCLNAHLHELPFASGRRKAFPKHHGRSVALSGLEGRKTRKEKTCFIPSPELSYSIQWPTMVQRTVRFSSPVSGFVSWEVLMAHHESNPILSRSAGGGPTPALPLPFCCYRHPLLFRVHRTPSRFYKRSTLVSVFANQVNTQEDLGFYEKRQKVDMHSALVLQWAILEAVPPEPWQRPLLAPSWELYSASYLPHS